MKKVAFACNELALALSSCFIWDQFFRPRAALPLPNSKVVGLSTYPVSAPLRVGVAFLVPTLLLVVGVTLQLIHLRATA